ncbi:hypothetical protein HGRIS_014692 [Hohenbuehelia grisea]|uniref:Uncharacterized protein n=1 Tax=Hohenbuehelia grisea TaxID=104357 RepID=A0ABR3JUA2_9AGAR
MPSPFLGSHWNDDVPEESYVNQELKSTFNENYIPHTPSRPDTSLSPLSNDASSNRSWTSRLPPSGSSESSPNISRAVSHPSILSWRFSQSWDSFESSENPSYASSQSPDIRHEASSSPLAPRLVRYGASRDERFQAALQVLREGHFSAIDLLLAILNPHDTNYISYRSGLFTKSEDKLKLMLDHIKEQPEGYAILMDWMRPLAQDLVCDTISSEMDTARSTLCLSKGLQELSPAYIKNWSHENILGKTAEKTPVLYAVLQSAAQTDRAKRVNTKKSPILGYSILNQQVLLTLSTSVFVGG